MDTETVRGNTMNKLFDNLFFNFFDEAFAEANKVTDKVALPLNIIREEDGSSTIEVAVVGKSEDDLIVKGITEDGKTFLTIESKEAEVSDDQKKAEEKREYTIRKIKGTGKLSIKAFIPSRLDLSKATKKVENGLLTIKIPVAEAAKSLEFEI